MRVSVIIPVWNGAATVGAAIASVLAQQFDAALAVDNLALARAAVEIVVVDDGSSDSTQAVLEGFGNRITVVRQANRGLAAARNAGVRAARGEYLAFLDADDQWIPAKLALTMRAFARDPECVMVYSDAVNVDAEGVTVSEFYNPPFQDHLPALSDLLARMWNILPSTMVVRRATFARVGGFAEEFKGSFGCEDLYFALRAREYGRFGYLGERLVFYCHSDPASMLRKRLGWIRECARAAGFAASVGHFMHNYEVLIRLVGARYGAAAHGLIGSVRRRQAALLTGIGLTAINQGDAAIARASFRYALRYAPADPRTYARLAWSLMPALVREPIAAAMPARLARSFEGPAQG
ncbi:MAG TPA: glycosyltransferase [Candidatus Binataceae bacterium]|nr:glycosyltransferase [Candidatus Binataceae bacterium]